MRYQWVDAIWKLDYSELKNALLKNFYTEEAGFGFILDEAYHNKKLSGRYIQKEVKDIEICSPLGMKDIYSQVVYNSYSFKIDLSSRYSLLLVDPPRSSIPLTSALSKATFFRVSIKSPVIDLVVWLDLIKLSLEKYSLKKIEVSQIMISPNILGNLNLKGDGDLLAELKHISNNNSGKIIRAEFSFSTPNGEGRATITHQGVVKMSNSLSDHHLLPILLNSLESL